jgi:Na+/H+ antiporter NhaD/arsenite permease-like protein
MPATSTQSLAWLWFLELAFNLKTVRDSYNASPVDEASAPPRASSAANLLGRLLLLGLCVVAGTVIGFIGQHFTGGSTWFLAVPALVICAWLFVANPDECTPPSERSSRDRSASR